MGTSVSQRSPDTIPWAFAQNAYTDPNMPVEVALRAIWRASDSRDGEQISQLLANPAVAELALVAVGAATPQDAARDATRLIISRRAASLATDLAKRAAVQCAGRPEPLASYIRTVFAEATNYLVSRDINGYVGASSKLPSVETAIQYKEKLVGTADRAVAEMGLPENVDRTTWPDVVRTVVNRLKTR